MEMPKKIKSLDFILGEKALSLDYKKNLLVTIERRLEALAEEDTVNDEMVQDLIEFETTLREIIRLTEQNQHQAVFREAVSVEKTGELVPVIAMEPRYEGTAASIQENKVSITQLAKEFNELGSSFEKKYPAEDQILKEMLAEQIEDRHEQN